MNMRKAASAAVVAAALCFGYWKWSGSASFGVDRTRPLPKAATVALDLHRPAGEPIDLIVASGKWFSVVLRNRTPGKTYRVEHETLLDPANPYRSKLKDLRGTYELAPDVEAPKPPRGQTLFPGDELRVSVAELDQVTGAVARTWSFSVHPPRPSLRWTYANEEHWIVSTTARDIVETVLYAVGAPPLATDAGFSVVADQGGEPGTPSYRVNVPAGSAAAQTYTLSFPHHIWSPRSYAPLAAGLIQALALRPAGGVAEGSGLLRVLEDPRSSVLERESQRISRALSRAALDRGAHEQAAVLVGTLALRETAGRFSDTRHALSRMAAHLSLAAALRAGAPESRLAGCADALLLTLVNRQADALARIDALERTGPMGAAFLRALRVRITHDWRLLRSPRTASLLERLEVYRAFQRSAGSSRAMQFLQSFQAEPISDWPRIAYTARPSIEEGNTFGMLTAALELKDFQETWRVFHGADLAQESVIEAFNVKPAGLVVIGPDKRTPMLRVIGWGMWARFFQRNLCFEAEAESLFLHSGLGATDEAREFRKVVFGALSGLQLTPVIEVVWTGPGVKGGPQVREGGPEELAKAKLEACRAAADLTQSAPEMLPATPWSMTEYSCIEERRTQVLAPASRWFNRGVPLGTALFDKTRAQLGSPSKQDLREACLKLHKMAPYDTAVIAEIMPYDEEWPFEERLALYGPLADYDRTAMISLVRLSLADPARARALYEKIVPISPDTYLEFADYLVDLELDGEAAAMYEKAIASARDRVGVSNSVFWLVGYYCDLGRVARAREVAEMAADVSSGSGLAAMGYLMERLGKYSEAEQWYMKIFQKYASREHLDEFYFRVEHRIGSGQFAAGAAAAKARIFPAGLERLALADLKSAQGSSVTIGGRSHKSTRFGLLKGDQVVALNGYRVRDDRQYRCIRTLTDDGEDSIIVWRKDRHIELKGRLKRIRYGPISSAGRARI